jgi:hypothetical protein
MLLSVDMPPSPQSAEQLKHHAWDFKTAALFGSGKWLRLKVGEKHGCTTAAFDGVKEGGASLKVRAAAGGIDRCGWFVDAPEHSFPACSSGKTTAAAAGAHVEIERPTVEFRALRSFGPAHEREAVTMLGRLTALLRLFDGAPRLHNFCDASEAPCGTRPPMDRETHLRNVRCRNHGLLWFLAGDGPSQQGDTDGGSADRSDLTFQEFACVSIAAPHCHKGMPCHFLRPLPWLPWST